MTAAIAEDQRSRIFERLYRVDGARQTELGEHAGLGLAIVKSIAELHGASVDVSCERGETTFGLQLPALDVA